MAPAIHFGKDTVEGKVSEVSWVALEVQYSTLVCSDRM